MGTSGREGTPSEASSRSEHKLKRGALCKAVRLFTLGISVSMYMYVLTVMECVLKKNSLYILNVISKAVQKEAQSA